MRGKELFGILTVSILSAVGCSGEPTMDMAKLPPPVNLPIQVTAGHGAQMAAADALGRIGPPAVSALSEALTDSNSIVRLHACRALAYMGIQAKDAVPALVRALDDKDESVKEQAARALGQIGLPAEPAVPALMQMLRGKQ